MEGTGGLETKTKKISQEIDFLNVPALEPIKEATEVARWKTIKALEKCLTESGSHYSAPPGQLS